MALIVNHITRCLLAGLVALLPIGGFVLSVVYFESAIAGSWLAKQPYYFPGLGLIAVTVAMYAIGLTVSTFVGRWLWNLVDRTLDRLPMLGRLYQTLKQIVGYGEGKDAMFRGVVLVPDGRSDGFEVGLLTNEIAGPNGQRQQVVFVPNAPNLTAGRLVVIADDKLLRLPMPVSDAMKVLLSVGKTPLALPD